MRPEKIPLNGRLSEFRQALEEEIDEVKKSGASSTLLNNGQKMEGRNGEYWYRFDVEYLPNLPADTPCKLKIGNEQFDVTVISFEDNSLMLSSKIALPDTLGKGNAGKRLHSSDGTPYQVYRRECTYGQSRGQPDVHDRRTCLYISKKI